MQRTIGRKRNIHSLHQPITFTALLLVGAWLRAYGLFAHTLHADEALFGTWARAIATWRDPLLWNHIVDKPPLLFYVQAVFVQLFDQAEFALRLPNFAASLLLIPLSADLTHHLFHNRFTTILSAILVITSPFLIQFSATGFTDPLMLTLTVAAAAALCHGQHGQSGVLFALALLTKYQALLLLPLLLICGLTLSNRWWWRRFGQTMLCLPLWLLLSGQWANFGRTGDAQLLRTIRIARPDEWLPRLRQWLLFLDETTVAPWLLLTAFVLIVALVCRDTVQRKFWKLTLFATVTFLFYWLLATGQWDRYMLPLAWLSLILSAHAIALSVQTPRWGVSAGARWMMIGLILIATLPVAVQARTELEGVGGMRYADNGSADISRVLQDAPYGTVLYDHWHSWHWRYYFYDSGVFVNWVPSPDVLVEDLTVFYDENRYIALVRGPLGDAYRVALADAGYQLTKLVESGTPASAGDPNSTDGIVLYKISR